MRYVDSDAFLDMLERQKLLSPKQHAFILKEKGKRRQQLLKNVQKREKELDLLTKPDLVDIIVSFDMTVAGRANGAVLDEEMIMQKVGEVHGIPFKKLDPLNLDMNIVTKTIPRNFALRQLILPIGMQDGVLEVAIYHPDCQSVLADIEQANQMKVTPCIATKSDILGIVTEFFGFQKSISAAEDQFSLSSGSETTSVDIGNLERYVKLSATKEISSSDEHIKNAINHIFSFALEQRASDIHIEPKRQFTMIRFRIDGVLHTIYRLPKAVHSAIVSRVKFLARLDIAEKRRPQDGRIKLGIKGEKNVEIRVSTVPVAFGEKTVMRLLDPDVIFQDVSELGFSERDLRVYESFITSPHGIVLVTGPTGSGKSTTLYSTLKRIATPERNIVTVEDPIEMVHEEFNQIAVQPLIDITFSTILRNILRQDPDVIMIGEIRDQDTANHAVQAAMTGHLVFSTLHTNDAVSSIVRLQDLGLEPFLISSTLLGAMAQRLVRTICPECKISFEMDRADLVAMGFPVGGSGKITLSKGEGCRMCRSTGYKGRCGVFEIFPFSSEIKRMMSAGKSMNEMRQVAIREGMTTLREDAWFKVRAGITTIEEALRVTAE